MRGRKHNVPRTNEIPTIARANGGKIPENGKHVIAAAKRDSGMNIGSISGEPSKHRADRKACGGKIKRANGGGVGGSSPYSGAMGGGNAASSPKSTAAKGLRSGGKC